MNFNEQEKIIESVLFVSGEPVPIDKIAGCVNLDLSAARDLILRLSEKYEKDKRGMVIIEIDNSFQMCTNPEYFIYIKSLYEMPKRKVLTQTLIETLAIIAYKQPITKSGIEEIRGVSADHSVNKLVEYNLVCERGRLNVPGRPILFGTTEEFLKYFGLKSLMHLPDISYEDEFITEEAYREVEGFM